MKQLTTILMLFSVLYSMAQEKEHVMPKKNIPLLTYLQHIHDTTIIYFPSGNTDEPRYFIIGKSGTHTALYTYINPYSGVRKYPTPVLHWFIQQSTKFKRTTPDTNSYFLPFRSILPRSTVSVWDSLMLVSPWLMRDDAIEGEGCGTQSKCGVFDDVTISFFLITKSAVRKSTFYAPDFYEKCCPGREGRQKALQLKRLFEDVFKCQAGY